MRMKAGYAVLSKGELCSCCMLEGKLAALVKENGAVKKTEYDLNSKSLKNKGVVSLAEECFLTETGRIERLEEFYYVEN